MRYSEIIRSPRISASEVRLPKITVPKSPAELQHDAGKCTKALSTIANAHAHTRDAADAYNKRMAADDEEEREQQCSVALFALLCCRASEIAIIPAYRSSLARLCAQVRDIFIPGS
jgi:hypothetical protein